VSDSTSGRTLGGSSDLSLGSSSGSSSGHACPSAQPDMLEARVFGVVAPGAPHPRVGYLAEPTPLTPELLDLLGDIKPTEVLRIAAHCEESRCSHFDGAHCTLAKRLKEALAPVTERLPPCTIRSTCRWYAEQGGEICLRCPQIVTLNAGSGDANLRAAAAPPRDARAG
jgi:hypothetical protein